MPGPLSLPSTLCFSQYIIRLNKFKSINSNHPVSLYSIVNDHGMLTPALNQYVELNFTLVRILDNIRSLSLFLFFLTVMLGVLLYFCWLAYRAHIKNNLFVVDNWGLLTIETLFWFFLFSFYTLALISFAAGHFFSPIMFFPLLMSAYALYLWKYKPFHLALFSLQAHNILPGFLLFGWVYILCETLLLQSHLTSTLLDCAQLVDLSLKNVEKELIEQYKKLASEPVASIDSNGVTRVPLSQPLEPAICLPSPNERPVGRSAAGSSSGQAMWQKETPSYKALSNSVMGKAALAVEKYASVPMGHLNNLEREQQGAAIARGAAGGIDPRVLLNGRTLDEHNVTRCEIKVPALVDGERKMISLDMRNNVRIAEDHITRAYSQSSYSSRLARLAGYNSEPMPAHRVAQIAKNVGDYIREHGHAESAIPRDESYRVIAQERIGGLSNLKIESARSMAQLQIEPGPPSSPGTPGTEYYSPQQSPTGGRYF